MSDEQLEAWYGHAVRKVDHQSEVQIMIESIFQYEFLQNAFASG